jgi:hypothetical protein
VTSAVLKPWFPSIAPEASIPDLDMFAPSDPAAQHQAYTGAGWPVHANDHGVYVVLGSESGLTAVRGPRGAITAWPDTRSAWSMQADEEAVAIFAHPGKPVRETEIRRNVTMLDPYDEDNPKNESMPVIVTVLPDGEELFLPTGGNRSRWRWNGGALFPFPMPFQRAVSRAGSMQPMDLSHLSETSTPVLTSGGLCRTGETALVFAHPGVGVTMLLVAAAVDHSRSDPSAHVLYLDFDGNGGREIVRRAIAMGLTDLSRFAIVEQDHLFAFTNQGDLAHLMKPNLVVVLDSLPGLCHLDGGTDRSGERVAPALRATQSLAAKHECAVLIADKAGRGARPRGASEKEEIVHASWHVRAKVKIRREHDGLLSVEKAAKDRSGELTDQLVAVRTGAEGRIIVEWSATDAVEQALALEADERVKIALLDVIRQRPRHLTKSELANMANVAGSRDQRRRVVEELEAEGLIRVVRSSRSERGRARTRPTYEVVVWP